MGDLLEQAVEDPDTAREIIIKWMRNRYPIEKFPYGSWQIREVLDRTTTTVSSNCNSTVTEHVKTIIHTESRENYVAYLDYLQWEADSNALWAIRSAELDKKWAEEKAASLAEAEVEETEVASRKVPFLQRVFARN